MLMWQITNLKALELRADFSQLGTTILGSIQFTLAVPFVLLKLGITQEP